MAPPIRVRFAPSPTGYLHIGGARTALFNWLWARQQGGAFVLRMEDTDDARNTDAARATIFGGLDWLGLAPDEGPEQGGPFGPYSQSERQSLYVEWGDRMKQTGALYPCFCTRERLAEVRAGQEAGRESLGYDGACRGLVPDKAAERVASGEEHTWRLKVPEDRTYRIQDLIRKEVKVESRDIEDIILIRANGIPVYNFAVVVDDHLMEISHVIRGEDHLTNTFKQVVIYEAFGWEAPVFAHLPLILGPTGQGKLSKRKHPEAALELYQERGYHVEALINWIALVGWSFDDKTVAMSRQELIERFSFDRVQSAGARLPLDKLDWLSGEYIRAAPRAEVLEAVRPYLARRGWLAADPSPAEARRLGRLVDYAQDRLRYYAQIDELAEWLYEEELDFEPKALKNLKKEGAAELLEAYGPILLGGDFEDPQGLEAAARAHCEAHDVGLGKLVHPVRAALTGRTQGPGLFECAAMLGRDETARRIAAALALARAGD